MNAKSNLHWVYLGLVICVFSWAANFNIGEYLVGQMNPLVAASWRFLLASVVMLLWVAIKEPFHWTSIRQNSVWLVLMGIVGIVGFNVPFFYGLQSTSAVNGTLIMTLNPSITVILSAWVMKDSISRVQVVGLLLSMFGVGIVVTGGSLHTLMSLKLSQGDLLILLANLCWACYGVMGKRLIKNLSSLQTSTMSMLAGAAALTTLSLFTNGSVATFSLPSGSVFTALIVMAVLGGAVGYAFWNQGVQKLGPARTAVFFDLMPVFTLIIAVCLGHQTLASHFVGAALVMAGVLCSSGILKIWMTQAPLASSI